MWKIVLKWERLYWVKILIVNNQISKNDGSPQGTCWACLNVYRRGGPSFLRSLYEKARAEQMAQGAATSSLQNRNILRSSQSVFWDAHSFRTFHWVQLRHVRSTSVLRLPAKRSEVRTVGQSGWVQSRTSGNTKRPTTMAASISEGVTNRLSTRKIQSFMIAELGASQIETENETLCANWMRSAVFLVTLCLLSIGRDVNVLKRLSSHSRETAVSRENNLLPSIYSLECFSGSPSSRSRATIFLLDRSIANGRHIGSSSEDRYNSSRIHKFRWLVGGKDSFTQISLPSPTIKRYVSQNVKCQIWHVNWNQLNVESSGLAARCENKRAMVCGSEESFNGWTASIILWTQSALCQISWQKSWFSAAVVQKQTTFRR
jgi:hypothetical protein